MNKRTCRLLAIIAALVIILAGGYGWLANGSYPAGDAARAALVSGGGVTVSVQDNLTVFAPDEAAQGFIFYPGGRVEHRAYAPLMRSLAEQGVLCVLVEMPFDLAVLDMNAGAESPERFPQVERWFIGGHSLGGAMAASHAAEKSYAGLILLAAYATAEIKDLPVLSIYGTQDQVLNREKYAANRGLLPENTREVVLEGGNHAQFGDYGHQKGDGLPAMDAQAQLDAAVNEILAFMAM